MPSTFGSPPVSESPLYVRWGPDRSPYAIELKLDLVARLRHEIATAGTSGQEIGGVLIGSLPTPQIPTLRIEDVDLIALRPEDGSTFMLEGGGSERFAEIRKRARAHEKVAVGLFRSHLRTGSLRPSLADRTLLAGEFKEPIYALLLASGTAPFAAAFFVASNGPLPAETSVREFQLNPADFQSLPELEPESIRRETPAPPTGPGLDPKTFALLSLAALFVLGTLFYLNRSLVLSWFATPAPLHLEVSDEQGLHRLSWNAGARELQQATGASVTLKGADEPSPRQISLGLDELHLGSVFFDTHSSVGTIVFALTDAKGTVLTQSATWAKQVR